MKLTKKDKRTEMEKLVDEQLKRALDRASTTKEVFDVIEMYQTVEAQRLKKKEKRQVSSDTIAVIAGNLLGIGLIMSYEKLNVITTKALGFVIRGRV